jgi:hypothetical protein
MPKDLRTEMDPIAILVHVFMGGADDLAPLSKSLGVAARFVLPEKIVDLARSSGWPCPRWLTSARST